MKFLRGPYTLRWLFIGQFLLTAAVATVVMSLLVWQWRMPVAQQQTRSELSRVADLALTQLEITLDNTESLGEALAQLVQGRLFQGQSLDSGGPLTEFLGYISSKGGLFDAIYLIDADLRVRDVALAGGLSARRQDLVGNDVSGLAVVSQARGDWRARWSGQFLSPAQSRPVVALVVPLVGGLVMIELSVERLARFTESAPLRDQLLLLVVDENGELLAGPEAANTLVQQRTNLGNLPLIQQAVAVEGAGDRYGAFEFAGRSYASTARHSQRLGWGLVVAYPESVVRAPLQAAVFISAATLLISISVGAFLYSWLANRLNQRVGDLVGQANAIEDGRYHTEVEPSNVVEFRLLQSSLGQMGETIASREKLLAEQDRQFRELVENTADLVVYFDADGVVGYSNPSANLTLAGASRSLTGQDILQLVAPESTDMLHQWFTVGLASGRTSYRQELRMCAADDSVRDVAWSASVERDANGRAVAFRCIGLDVTAQRQSEAAVRLSEQRLRAIVESTPSLAIQWFDREGRVLDWNSASERMLGWRREDTLGKTLRELIYSDEQQAEFMAMLVEVERTGQPIPPYESVVRHPDGRERVMLSTTFAIPGDKGQPWFICMDIDITARKQAEAETIASERRFQVLFNANPVAVAALRRQGSDFVYLDVNQAWVGLIGHPREQVVGQRVQQLRIMKDSEQRWPRVLGQLERERFIARAEGWLIRADGSSFRAEGSLGLVTFDEGEWLIYSLHDVTDKRRMEADLRTLNAELEDRIAKRTESLMQSNAELEQALDHIRRTQDRLVQAEKLASLGSLVAGVAHELNTPVGNGLMAVSTLHDRVKTFSEKMGQGLKRSELEALLSHALTGCDIAARNLHRASHLITSFKQVAVDQTSAQRRSFELREVVDEIVLTLQPTLKRSSHQVDCDVPDGLELDSYPGPLGQVLTNLVQNALVHGLEGVEGGRVDITARALGDDIELSVGDNGSGIPEAVQRHVFDPFYTTKLGQGGSGLGLPIVRTIVSGALGGSIDFHNRSDRGVVFVVRIPRVAPAPVQGGEAAAAGHPAGRVKKALEGAGNTV